MALLYTNCESGIAAAQLHSGQLCLIAGDTGTGLRAAHAGHPDSIATLVNAGGEWILIADPGTVRLNGLPLNWGIAVLSHKDQLRLCGEQHYFSSESPVSPRIFTGNADARCALCDQPLVGEITAPCPGCGLWFHARDAADCFGATPNCPSCGAAIGTDLEIWSPLEERL